MGFTRHATDLFISEKIGQVLKCGATDVACELPASGEWVSTFGLCVILQDHPPAQNRQFALQFVRRVEMAFAEYSRAYTELSEFVSDNTASWPRYFRALYHFEAAITQLYLAYDGARKRLRKDYFEPDDGSTLERLGNIYDASKHDVASSDQTVCISNDGISANPRLHGRRRRRRRSNKNGKSKSVAMSPTITSISFVEVEDLLRSYGHIANQITNQAG